VKTRINWLGLAGGVTTIVVVIVSFFYPWWRFSAWNDRIVINVSPVNTNFNFLGTTFTIPLISALNIVSLLTLTASGISMLIYSVMPTKTYSKHLLGFAYKKPLFSLVFSVVVLFVMTLIIQALLGFNVPLVGSSTATLPQNMTMGVTISVAISGGFQWPFWLAAVAAGLCIAARLYNKRITATLVSSSTAAPSAAAAA
jgi:hypothetical protein